MSNVIIYTNIELEQRTLLDHYMLQTAAGQTWSLPLHLQSFQRLSTPDTNTIASSYASRCQLFTENSQK